MDATPAPEAVKPFPHLMIIQPCDPKIEPYCFNLNTAAFDELSRSTEFRWAFQDRLTRRPAKQAIGMGDEKLTLKGAIYPGVKGGLKQLDPLRSIGARLQPLTLTTGYGEVIGTWCLKSINEEQATLMQGDIPRQQGFTLGFERYGDDMQVVGDMLDVICNNVYGQAEWQCRGCARCEPGLADEPQPFRLGVVIVLPDLLSPPHEGVSLWN